MKRKQRRPDQRHGRTWRDDGYSGGRVPINEHVSMASPEDVLRAVERFARPLDWASVAPNVVPLFPRRRPLPLETDQVSVLLPPGIMTGFGVDAGPAFMHVGSDALARWSIGPDDLTARALENVRLRVASCRSRNLVKQAVDGLVLRALQTGAGVASALLLLPDEIVRIFGSGRQCFIAPMRDLLVSVEGEPDPDDVAWINEELASLDPNALALDAFALRDGVLRLEPLRRDVVTA